MTAKSKKPSNPVGRPREIQTPEQMDSLVDGYLQMCKEANPPEPITLTGMILALGLSCRQSFDLYLNYPEFIDSVKRAKYFIEHEYEKRLISGNNAASSIFALKNFGWMDKYPTYLDELSAKKLERELQLEDEQVQPASVVMGVKDASKPKA
jgi:hypothetical protein